MTPDNAAGVREPATARLVVCEECDTNGCPSHNGPVDCKPGCAHPDCRAREIAAGLAELGTGGTPAFIRGYNAGYDDAFAHEAEARQSDAAPGLDVDRLTLALERAEINCWANPVQHAIGDPDGRQHRLDAEAIARQYAAATPEAGE